VATNAKQKHYRPPVDFLATPHEPPYPEFNHNKPRTPSLGVSKTVHLCSRYQSHLTNVLKM